MYHDGYSKEIYRIRSNWLGFGIDSDPNPNACCLAEVCALRVPLYFLFGISLISSLYFAQTLTSEIIMNILSYIKKLLISSFMK